MSDEGRLVAGRYRLSRRIGTGAMGIVWQAYDERLNRTVAVKQLLLQAGLSAEEADEARLRSMREGRIAARLHHPNAITVFDVVDEDGAPWLIMEYLASRSLAAVMNEHGPLPPDEVAGIGSQIASALAAAHAAGIVHRDIKPANILLGDNGSVKITDFGISRASDDVQVTKTGLIAGTPAYLAPEVAYGREPTAATDVFSLGSTLYAATEGEPPFGLSENTLGLLHAVAAGRIIPPTKAGPLSPVLAMLLATEPEDRPSAAESRDLLDAVANGETIELPVGYGESTTLVAGAAAPGDGTTRMVGHADRTQVVGQGDRTRVVTQGSRPPMVGPGPAETSFGGAEPVRRSRAPLAMGAIALAIVIAFTVWFLSNRSDRDNDNPTNVNGTTTSSQPQSPVEVPLPVETTTSSPERTTKPRSTTTRTTTEEPPPATTTTNPTTTTRPPTSTQSSNTQPSVSQSG